MARLKGLLFDKDGTLFDFRATWRGVVIEILEDLTPDPALRQEMARVGGFDIETGQFEPGSAIVAASTGEIAALWEPLCPGRTLVEIEAIANRAASDPSVLAGRLVPAAKDLPALLTGFRSEGYALGVATHDSEAAARAQLGSLGLVGAFDFIAGYDSGHGLKPGPGMLTAFARHCKLALSEVAVIGDSVHDLMMARNGPAGLAIGVLTGPALAEDLAPTADHVIPSIDALPRLLKAHKSERPI